MHTFFQPLLVYLYLFTHLSFTHLSAPHLISPDLFFCPTSETSSPSIVLSLSDFNRGVRTFPVLKAHSHASISRNQYTITLLYLNLFVVVISDHIINLNYLPNMHISVAFSTFKVYDCHLLMLWMYAVFEKTPLWWNAKRWPNKIHM